MTDEQIAEIAGKLTEAQKRAIVERHLETKKSIDAEIALIANYFRKMGMTQVAMSIEAGDYKNEK